MSVSGMPSYCGGRPCSPRVTGRFSDAGNTLSAPLVSRITLPVSCRPLRPWERMPSIRSDRSKHSRDSSSSQMRPLRTSTLGLPQMIARRRMLQKESRLSRLCISSSVRMAISPPSSGISTSPIGCVARSEIISVMTTSYG